MVHVAACVLASLAALAGLSAAAPMKGPGSLSMPHHPHPPLHPEPKVYNIGVENQSPLQVRAQAADPQHPPDGRNMLGQPGLFMPSRPSTSGGMTPVADACDPVPAALVIARLLQDACDVVPAEDANPPEKLSVAFHEPSWTPRYSHGPGSIVGDPKATEEDGPLGDPNNEDDDPHESSDPEPQPDNRGSGGSGSNGADAVPPPNAARKVPVLFGEDPESPIHQWTFLDNGGEEDDNADDDELDEDDAKFDAHSRRSVAEAPRESPEGQPSPMKSAGARDTAAHDCGYDGCDCGGEDALAESVATH